MNVSTQRISVSITLDIVLLNIPTRILNGAFLSEVTNLGMPMLNRLVNKVDNNYIATT
jgi:hypothetical protein